MKLDGFLIARPQQIAALLLLVLFGECLWAIAHQPLDANDYRYARCGREMWERPSPLQGYFTTCGNLNGDGTLAYRIAGFPLTVQRLVLLAADKLRKPGEPLVRRRLAEREHVGSAPRVGLCEVSDAGAVCAVCGLAGRRFVVGFAAAVWQ